MGAEMPANSNKYDWLGLGALVLFLLKSLFSYPITGLTEEYPEHNSKQNLEDVGLKPVIYTASLMIWFLFLGWGLYHIPSLFGLPFRPLNFIYSQMPNYFFIACGFFYTAGLFIFLWSRYRALRG